MDIRRLIRETIEEMVTQDVIAFKNYLKMNDKEKGADLAHTYSYLVNDFFEEELEDTPEQYAGMETYEIVDEMQVNDEALFERFAHWVLERFNRGGRGMEHDRPAWSAFDQGEIIRNQWLVHFTDQSNAYDIVRNGFTKGVDDISQLGWTSYMPDSSKERGGYNFAFHWSDVKRYGSNGKYGNTAVIFMASGVKADHHGDEEPQVVFYGNTAKHRNVIHYNRDLEQWELEGTNGRVLARNERVHEVVNWFVSFYDRFRSVLN